MYWKGGLLKELGGRAIAKHVEHGGENADAAFVDASLPGETARRIALGEGHGWSHRDAIWSEVIVG